MKGFLELEHYVENQVKEAVEKVRKGLSLLKVAEKFWEFKVYTYYSSKRNKVGRPFVLYIEEQKIVGIPEIGWRL